MITSIQTRGGENARLFCSTPASNFSVLLRLTELPPEHQSAWGAALAFAASSVLQEGESIASVQIHPTPKGVILGPDTDETPAERRDLIEFSLSIKTADGGSRYADVTSEQLPEETRTGLLALYTFLEGKTRQELEALA